MNTIHLSDPVFARLQGFVVPLVDTPDTVLTRLMDAFDAAGDGKGLPLSTGDAVPVQCDPFALPDLRHTKLVSAALDGVALTHPSWNAVVQGLLLVLIERAEVDQVLRTADQCGVRLLATEKLDEGFTRLASVPGRDLPMSYQGLSAMPAAKAAVALACCINYDLEIVFQWRASKPGALHPGRFGELRLNEDQWKLHPSSLPEVL